MTTGSTTPPRDGGLRRALGRHLTPPSGQGRRTRPTMIALPVRAVVFAVPGVIGGLLYGALSPNGSRAAWSYVGGLALTAVLLVGGVLAVRAAAAIAPQIATIMAMSTYFTVAAVLLAVFALANPHVLDAPAFAVGLVVGVVVGIALQIRDAQPPPARD